MSWPDLNNRMETLEAKQDADAIFLDSLSKQVQDLAQRLDKVKEEVDTQEIVIQNLEHYVLPDFQPTDTPQPDAEDPLGG